MKEPRLITLAQQGDENAIATLLNRFPILFLVISRRLFMSWVTR
ncbi:MAG: hypothetical protein ACLFV6_02610 [Spirulinaceae cyanobacterium]